MEDDDDSWKLPPVNFNADERGPFPLLTLVIAIGYGAIALLVVWMLVVVWFAA